MLRLVPTLTKQHIELPAFSKMKIKGAAQVFSYSAGCNDDLYMLRSFATRSVGLSYGSFCGKKMDSLFDIFNSIGLHDVKLYKRASQDNSPSYEYLCVMTDIFKRLQIQGSRGATPCITGWQLSISAVIALWNDVKSECVV